MKRSTIALYALLATLLSSCIDHDLPPVSDPPTERKAWIAGGTGDDEGKAIATDVSGNIYITGRFSGNATLGGQSLSSAGDSDIFVAKFSPGGTLLWLQRAGGTAFDMGLSIALDGGGNVYVGGIFAGSAAFGTITLNAAGNTDGFVAKFNASGVVQWVQRNGGPEDDRVNGISVDPAGEVYAIGDFSGTASIGGVPFTAKGSGQDFFLAKYDMNGATRWAKQFGDSSFETGLALKAAPDGTVYITGGFTKFTNLGGQFRSVMDGLATSVFLARVGGDGNVQWVAIGPAFDHGYGRSIALDAQNNVYLTGDFSASIGFASVSGAGGMGYTQGGNNGFLVKYDQSGTFQWFKLMFSSNLATGRSVAVDADGNVYQAGEFRESITIDGKQTLTTGTAPSLYFTKFKQDGTLLWAIQEGGSNNEMLGGLATAPDGSLFATGYFYFETTLAGQNFTSAGQNDMFLLKIR